jgi:ankyrin repeat protein
MAAGTGFEDPARTGAACACYCRCGRGSRGAAFRAAFTAFGAAAGVAVAITAHADDALLAAARAGDHDAALARVADHADVRAADATGTTALHWAVYNDDAALVRALIAAGADVTAPNAYGSTPMAEAAVTGDVEVLELLLDAGADVDSPNAEGQTALMVLARTENVAAAELLLARGADVNARESWKDQTALMWAAARGRPDMVRLLAAHGADVDARSAIHEWPRQTTVFPRAKYLPHGGFTPLLFAAREGCVACAEELVLAGADIDLPDPDEVTPLLMALLNAHFDAARYLVEAGANVNKWDWWGRTPLYAAVDYETLPVGGRPDRPSLDATTSAQTIELLLNAGANPNAQLKLLQPFRNVLDDRGTDLQLGIGATPLIRAARGGDAVAVRLLLAHGALPDLAQDQGMTPLMVAAGLRSYTIDTRGRYTNEDEAITVVNLLLDAGADIALRDSFGQTALHGAAFRGWSELVRTLVARGADLDAADDDGHTPLDAANGRIRGIGREASVVNVYPETAALIESLLANAP